MYVLTFSIQGFKCFKSYFEAVNIGEHRIRRHDSSLIVEKHDLVGLPYLWQLVLETPCAQIAEEATKYLISVSYTFLAPKLKKVNIVIHHSNGY